MRILLFSLFLLTTGCVSYKTDDKQPNVTLTTFPVKPELIQYTRKPIITSIDKDYQVSDEFITNSVLYKKYSDKIDEWKKTNDIK